MKEWTAADLKPGDSVIVQTMFEDDHLATVYSLTETQIVLQGCNARFWRKNGKEVGGSYYRMCYLREASPARMSSIRRTRILGRLHGFRWGRLDNATLDKVVALLPTEAAK